MVSQRLALAFLSSRLLSIVCSIAVCLFAQPAKSAEPSSQRASTTKLTPAEEELLLPRVSCDFKDVPLCNALEQLSGGNEPAKIVLEGALANSAVVNMPVTLHVESISRQSALNLLLAPLELGHWVEAGVIHVDLLQNSPSGVVERTYYVGDLGNARWGRTSKPSAQRDLEDLVRSTVAPNQWDWGSVELSADKRFLTVTQTRDNHEQVINLIDQLRFLAAGRSADVLKSIQAKATLSLIDQPLGDVVAAIGKAYDVNLVIDEVGLNKRKSSRELRVTLKVEDATLRQTLRELSKSGRLSFSVENEVLMISDAQSSTYCVVYSVADLVRANADKPAKADFNPLIERIQKEVRPASWIVNGESASIAPFETNLSLVVSQTREGHDQIASLLDGIRTASEKEKSRESSDKE